MNYIKSDEDNVDLDLNKAKEAFLDEWFKNLESSRDILRSETAVISNTPDIDIFYDLPYDEYKFRISQTFKVRMLTDIERQRSRNANTELAEGGTNTSSVAT